MQIKSILFAILGAFFFVFSFSEQAAAQTKKTFDNAYGLVGTRSLKLQWLGEKMGKVKIQHEGEGEFSIEGSVESNGDYCVISGTLLPIDANRFRFEGIIRTRVSFINNGQECLKEATLENAFIFEKKNGRKYYRLQQMENCEGNNVVDYVDVFEF
ncbi:hypothetical protein [Hugenholtzia roseola]|uniref:hypothetical protein n=1 Tax=Hugenholtzia roseola TaxID=1002 RepID=UPI000688BB6E|nr:hypothetical protein [Hugenholtzia roseola]